MIESIRREMFSTLNSTQRVSPSGKKREAKSQRRFQEEIEQEPGEEDAQAEKGSVPPAATSEEKSKRGDEAASADHANEEPPKEPRLIDIVA